MHDLSMIATPIEKSKAPDFSEARPYLSARGTSARAAMSFYPVTTTAVVKLQSDLARVDDKLFLGEKLESAVSFRVNGVSEIAVNCWKHCDDRTALVVVRCIIDLFANCKLRHRELLPELSKHHYLH
jgi:hypothetical protein